MSEKRRGLGRGLGALIPSTAATKPSGDRPVDDVFFREAADAATATVTLERPDDAPSQEAPPSDEARADQTVPPPASAPESSDDSEATDPESGESPAPVEAEVSDDGLVPVPGARFAEIPVAAIRPNPRQPRQVFDEEGLSELVVSVREIGVLQPIVVRPVGDDDGDGAGDPDRAVRYELIMGERRWRAVQEAGLETIPSIVRETPDDDLLRDALLENLHRSQLNPLEEAAAYQQLLDDFGCTHEELATRIGRSRPQISNTIRLLRLPPLVQRRVAAGVLSAGHARALLGLEDSAGMENLAQRIVAEGLSVRAAEEVVALGDAPSPPAAARKRPRAGSHRNELDELAGRLGDVLDTRVGIQLGQRRGKISIDFASVDDLNRILTLMSPQVRGVFAAQSPEVASSEVASSGEHDGGGQPHH